MQNCNGDDFAQLFDNKDSVFVLCYAILMLHTDLHSSKLKQKMSLEVIIVVMLIIIQVFYIFSSFLKSPIFFSLGIHPYQERNEWWERFSSTAVNRHIQLY